MSARKWTRKKTKAAQLVAEDKLTDNEIAAAVKVSQRTLERWKLKPAFAGRVAELVKAAEDAVRQALLTEGIADRVERVRGYGDRRQRLQQIITERGQAEDMQKVPGGATGLLVRTKKQIGGGEYATIVDEYQVDVGTLRELRELEKQAAQDLGQWAEKRELTGKDGGPIVVKGARELTDDELAAIASGGGTGAAEP